MTWIRVLYTSIILAIGILIGFIIKNFPLISWNKEIKVYEVFQVVSTLFIAAVIPFLIKKWIDDGRLVKSLLGEESKDILEQGKKINNKLLECYQREDHRISSEEKQFILFLFTGMENAIANFGGSLKTSFGDKCNNQFQDVKIAYYSYWNKITGSNLMSDQFTKVDLEFLSFHMFEYNLWQTSIRGFLIYLQKL
jgi:hypothetical protein